MPNKNGFDALKEIFAHDSNARALMVSAIKDKAMIRDCLDMGAKGFIEKPLKFKRVKIFVRISQKVLRTL